MTPVDPNKKEVIKTYVFQHGYIGVNRNPKKPEEPKTFVKGDVVSGPVTMPQFNNPNIKIQACVLVEDKYLIPLTVLEEKKDGTLLSPELDVLAKAKAMKNDKSFKNGAMVGAGAGVIYGFVTRRSIIVTALIGLVAGGAISHLLFKNSSKEETADATKK